MRLFAYYALHSFKNQLRKLLKTWILIFFVICLVVGIAVGALFAAVDSSPEPVPEPDASWQTEEPADRSWQAAEEPDEEWGDTEVLPEAEPGASPVDILELVAGGIVLVMFVVYIMNADKNGSRIFLPADVNLLFSAPLKPQSVLMFRLGCQLGMALLMSVYMLFQIPNLVLNAGLSLWAALALVAAWVFTIVYAVLLQVLIYTLASTYPLVKRLLRPVLYGSLLALTAAFLLFANVQGDGLLQSAVSFFSARPTRLIPVWGWIKGLCGFAAEGSLMGVVLCALALILGIAVFVWVIWRIRADFYEDAMAKSEETAELLERAQSEKSGLLVSRRKKDRADSLRRDGMRHGAGANVFFFRSLYNRFRFAHFGFLTKTMETYLVAAIAVSLLSHSILAVALILAALTFFRTLGNPLEQDTMTDFFRMIPESTWAKLFWSLMGGTANCLLDVIPAVLLGALLTGTNVLTALIWIPVIVSVDFYATCIGTFIGVSVPVSAGKMMKQVVQILFIYFGLLPDIILAVLGMNHDSLALSMAGATVLNIGLGFLFFGLCPIFLEPANIRRKRVVTEFHGEPRKARRQISTLAAALAMILFLVPLIQRGVFFVFDQIWPQGDLPAPAFWLGSFLSMYLVAMPVAALLMRLVPAHPPEQHSVRPARFVQVAIICIFLLYTFNIGGALILLLLQSLLGIETINPMMELVADDVWWLQSLIMVVAAPVFEELIYRKLLIDRIRIYGERFAVVISGLAFGLTHGNLSQFFYAAALGCAFAYVYLRSGRIRYTIGLHMLINFLGGVVAPGLLIFIDLEGLATKSNGEVLKMLTPLLIYVAVMVALSLTGLVLFCNNVRNIRFEPMELEMPRGMMLKTVFCNAGTILFLAGTIYLFAQTFLP